MAAIVGATALVPGVSQAEGPSFNKITARDYKFLGVPKNPSQAGLYKFGFKNNGEKVHEFVLLKNNSGMSNRDLLELSKTDFEAAESQAKFMGATFAKPGEKGDAFTTWLKPGRYFVACFVQNSKTAPAHWEKGMLRGLTVTK
jgi:uncharacterized cupredoxin-like copper-binding protein